MTSIAKSSHVYGTAKIVEGGKAWKADIRIGERCFVGDFCFVAARRLVMEEGSQISPHAVICGGGEVILGKYSTVGFGAQLITGTDTVEGRYMCEAAPESARSVIRGTIELGEGAYIGANTVICISRREKNIAIGDFSVVGALTYIDKSIPPKTIVYTDRRLITKPRRLVASGNR